MYYLWMGGLDITFKILIFEKAKEKMKFIVRKYFQSSSFLSYNLN